MTIKDFGARVADVWEGLRPVTRRMVVGALQQQTASSANSAAGQKFFYDAHSDWELSRLLSALDDRAGDAEARKNLTNLRELRRIADVTARVLEAKTESAEIFIQLVERALLRYDYARVDSLADALTARFSAAEVCEIVRQAQHAPVRALAFESLAQVPVSRLFPLIDDPLYADIVRTALEQQAFEFESEDARILLEQLMAEELFGE
ncbi:MAG: hypothetical protein M3209_03465 [Acidobacteriota bacterium]|nr:hypothetical protein [Acidobacteriota bacterium]